MVPSGGWRDRSRAVMLLVVLSMVASGFGQAVPAAAASNPLTPKAATPAWILDASFNPDANFTVDAVALESDGNILVGGRFSSLAGMTHERIARLAPYGTVATAGLGSLKPNNPVTSVHVNADGSILLAGSFGLMAGSPRGRLARISPDGALQAFNPNANGAIDAMAIQADQKILIGGSFTKIGGDTRLYLARIAVDGTLDAFNASVNGEVRAIAVQPDGKILIGGSFTSVGGASISNLARLTADGAPDAAFRPEPWNPPLNEPVNSIAVQSDGKIVIGGNFTRSLFSGGYNRVGRLNANGTADATFNPGDGANNIVNKVLLQSDGKILVSGMFTKMGGVARGGIARLNADGSIDSAFDPTGVSGGNAQVLTMALQADGSLVIGGDFSKAEGVARNRIARLRPVMEPSAPTGVTGTAGDGEAMISWSAPTDDGGSAITAYTVTSSPDGLTCSTNGTTTCTVLGLSNGTAYTFTVTATNGKGVGPASAPSAAVTPVAAMTVPSAPLNAAAIAGDARANVSWTAPTSDGGSAITGYTVVSSPGGLTCTTSGQTSCAVIGLTNGTPYSFTVTAANAVGTGAPSRPSPEVTPRARASGDGGGGSGGGASGAVGSGPGAAVPTVLPAGPSSEVPAAVPDLAVGRSGEALVRVVGPDGVPVQSGPPVVVPLAGRDGKVVRAPGWSVELQGVEESGRAAPLNAAGNLEVVRGLGLATSGRGFAPNSPVAVYLFSDPRTLGALTTDAQGAFAGTVPVPADVPVGVHTAQVSGFTPSGDRLIVSLGIEVAAPLADPLVSAVPARVQPLWWLPVTGPEGQVQVLAGSSGCSAMDGDGSSARGRSLVFWGLGTCVFEVRSGGRAWRTYRIPIVPKAEKTDDVRQLPFRRIWFTGDAAPTERSVGVLERAMPRLKNASASYAYWLDSRDRQEAAKVSRQHVVLGRELQAQGPVRGIRTIPIPAPWRPAFGEFADRYILIAWKPRP